MTLVMSLCKTHAWCFFRSCQLLHERIKKWELKVVQCLFGSVFPCWIWHAYKHGDTSYNYNHNRWYCRETGGCIWLSLKSCVSQRKVRNTLRPRQNGRHFADYVFKCIFLNWNLCVSIKSSLNFVPKGPINNIPALVQIMAWRRTGGKPLSEPMMA